MRSDKKKYLLCVFFIFLFSLIFFIFSFIPQTSAEVGIGEKNYSINKDYSSNQNISGWINISLENEPFNSFFNATIKDSDGKIISTKRINLEKIIEKNLIGEEKYSCSTKNCETDYLTVGSHSSEKIFDLKKGDEQFFGFFLEEHIVKSINSIEFVIDSDAQSSCENQLKIDFFNNEKTEVINDKSTDSFLCGINFGCYEGGYSVRDAIIKKDNVYCQRISLPESSGFNIGAFTKSKEQGETIWFYILDLNMNEMDKGKCSLSSTPESTSGFVNLGCSVEYQNLKEKDHYICVYYTGNSEFGIKADINPERDCGFFNNMGIPPSRKDEVAAYSIFARGKRFDIPGEILIGKNKEYPEKKLGEMAWDYLKEKYILEQQGINCDDGCFIPFKIISNSDQNLKIKNISLSLELIEGSFNIQKIYELKEIPSNISFDFSQIRIDSLGILVPEEKGDYYFSLKLNGKEIVLDKKISVKDVPKINSVVPRKTASAYPTEFTVDIINIPTRTTIQKYTWEFIKGSEIVKKETTSNKTTHTFSDIGDYVLRINITDSDDFFSTKEFNINVELPKGFISTKIPYLEERIDNVENSIKDYSAFHKKIIENYFNISGKKTEINSLKNKFDGLGDEAITAEYNNILKELFKIESFFPKEIQISRSGDLIFTPEQEYLDLDIIKKIAGGSYDKLNEENYKKELIFWEIKNLNVLTKLTEYSSRKQDDSISNFVKIIEIEFKEKESIDYPYYLIFPKTSTLFFEEDLNEKIIEENGFNYIRLQDNKKISFYYERDIDFSQLKMFVSPSLDNFDVEVLSIITKEESNIILLILIGIGLLIIFFVVYFVLHNWYQKKYENYLFPNKNDLYNIINYINSSKKREISEKEIIKNLKKSGWGSEQIKYCLKKYSGKKVGMPGIKSKNKKETSDKKNNLNNTKI